MALSISNLFNPPTKAYTPTETSTPASIALNNKQQGTAAPAYVSGNPLTGAGLSISAPTTPTAPIKKSTYTDATGNSVTHHYDNTPLVSGNSYDSQTGLYSSGSTIPGSSNSGQGYNGGALSPAQVAAGNTYTQQVNNSNPTGTNAPTKNPANQTPTYSGLITSLANTAQGQGQANPLITNAADQITELRKQAAQAQGANLTSGELSPVAQGRNAVIAQTEGSLEQGIQQGIQNKLAANQQAISGLGTAAGLAQPTGDFPFVYNPLTGSFSAPGTTGGSTSQTGGATTLTYDPQTDANAFAQKVISGQIPYSDAVSAMGYARSVAKGLLDSAITSKGGNITAIQAMTSGQQSALQNIPTWTAANTAAKGIENTINGYLKDNPSLNSNTLAAANAVQQWIQGKQLSDPKYQTLINYLTEYTNTLAPVLGVGGDTTNMKTSLAQGMINAASSGATISEVLNNIGTLADTKIKNYQSGALGGGTVGGTSQSTSSNSNPLGI